jgi:hypothetical protein
MCEKISHDPFKTFTTHQTLIKPWTLNKQTYKKTKLLNTTINEIRTPQVYQSIEANPGQSWIACTMQASRSSMKEAIANRIERDAMVKKPKTVYNKENTARQSNKGTWPQS